jgi:excisionase family DNA binding protein
VAEGVCPDKTTENRNNASCSSGRGQRAALEMQIESKPEQRLYDIPSAVGYLQSIGAMAITKSFVRTLIASGGIPHLKLGKKYYVTRSAMDDWLTRHERRNR